MKVYTVTPSKPVHSNMAFDTLFDGKSASGPRITASSVKWPGPFEWVKEGALDTLDLEDNHDRRALLVGGLQQCSAVFYLYMKPNAAKHTISAALAFHSPSGGLDINRGRQLRGPLAEAETVERKNVLAKDVYVLMAAGPSTMGAHLKLHGEQYEKAAMEEHKLLIHLLDGEKIPAEHRIIYCSALGQFGLTADGFLGEPGAPTKK